MTMSRGEYDMCAVATDSPLIYPANVVLVGREGQRAPRMP